MRRLAAVLGALVVGIGAPMASTGSALAVDSASAHGPAQLSGSAPATPSVISLHIVIGPPQGPGPSKRTEPVVVLLRCDAPGNEHPYPAEACAEVEAAKGDIDAIPPGSSGCAGVWQPVRLSVSGVVAGESVQWSDQVSNEGCAVNSHGHVFRIPLDVRQPDID
ncbi:hypothetical protein I0C86_17890 [Plantactinospora sp. S1510]|uniref:Subtilisin inhibitor domain-containing protein n=1 Tax=Plantactinospora alkalitolerans TaxID=2789879 RepID=A0ABS0GX95_9ACTN|nr:SSI family serine proteinase inhibitor [Plantactinospora alkalitolerans]MBF9130817.1 hypothetical protein [Plantactinospora alkalitolerans]